MKSHTKAQMRRVPCQCRSANWTTYIACASASLTQFVLLLYSRTRVQPCFNWSPSWIKMESSMQTVTGMKCNQCILLGILVYDMRAWWRRSSTWSLTSQGSKVIFSTLINCYNIFSCDVTDRHCWRTRILSLILSYHTDSSRSRRETTRPPEYRNWSWHRKDTDQDSHRAPIDCNDLIIENGRNCRPKFEELYFLRHQLIDAFVTIFGVHALKDSDSSFKELKEWRHAMQGERESHIPSKCVFRLLSCSCGNRQQEQASQGSEESCASHHDFDLCGFAELRLDWLSSCDSDPRTPIKHESSNLSFASWALAWQLPLKCPRDALKSARPRNWHLLRKFC